MRPVGHLESPGLPGQRTRVGPPLAAEELALDQPGGQARAVHLDERPVVPRAQPVDGVGDELLAHAGLAEDEDGRAGAGHLLDLTQDVPDRRALPDDPFVAVVDRDLLSEVRVLRLEPRLQHLDLSERPPELVLDLLERGDIDPHSQQVLLTSDLRDRALRHDRDQPAVLGQEAVLAAGPALAEPSLDRRQ